MEKLIYSQINTYISDKFSKNLTGFRKNHNTQHVLLNMIENWKIDKQKAEMQGRKLFQYMEKNYIRRPARFHTWALAI